MTQQVGAGIKLRLFIGCLVNSEVRMHLNYSEKWKREQVIRSEDGEPLEKIRHEEKEYVGVTIEESVVEADLLSEKEQYVRRALEAYCPELEVEKFKLSLIPQLFLA